MSADEFICLDLASLNVPELTVMHSAIRAVIPAAPVIAPPDYGSSSVSQYK
jgi:hypothetical protein